jgi:hypothetical protein
MTTDRAYDRHTTAWLPQILFVPVTIVPSVSTKNLKKILKCNSNIHFNQECINRGLVPKYARINVPNISPATTFTNTTAHKLHINDEIKFYA